MRRCPNCNELLTPRTAGSITVDGCAACGGIWLDQGELAALARERPQELRQIDEAFRPGMQPEVGTRRTHACPGCGADLVETSLRQFPNLSIDGCPHCRGVWFDHGELSAIGDQLAPPAKGAPLTDATDTGPEATDTSHTPLVRAHLLPQVRRSAGFFDSVSRGFAFVRNAYALAAEKKSLLTPMLIGGITLFMFGLVMFGIGFGIYASAGGLEGTELEDMPSYVRTSLVVLGLFWTFGNFFLGYFFMGVTVSMIDAYLKGREPELRVGWQDAMKNIAAIAALAVMGTVVDLIANSLRERDNLLTNLLARAIEAAWTVLSFLLLPVIMIEDVSLGEALNRVRDIHRRNVLQIAVGEVGIRFVVWVIGLALGGIAVLLGAVLFPLKLAGLIIWAVLFVGGASVLNLINTFAKAAYYTCLYLWAVEIERAGVGEPVMVPAPLAEALSA